MKLKKTLLNIKHQHHLSSSSHTFLNSYTIKQKSKPKTKKQYTKLPPYQLQYLLLKTHSSTQTQYNTMIINCFLNKNQNHFHTQLNDVIMYDNTSLEYLKKFYFHKETKSKLKKYFHFYKNYLTFFCRPNINEFYINKIMLKNIEKVAQAFYAKTYNKKEQQQKHKKTTTLDVTSGISNFLFTEGVVNEIENNSYDDNNNNKTQSSLFDISNIMTTEQYLIKKNKKEESNNQNDQTLNLSINLILNAMTTEKPKSYKREKVDCSKNKITNLKPINVINKPKIPLKQAIQNKQMNKEDVNSIKHLVLNGYNNFAFPAGLNKFISNNSPSFQRRNINLNRVRLKSNNVIHNKHIFNSSDSTSINFNNNNNNNNSRKSLSVGHVSSMKTKSKSASNLISNLDEYNNNKPPALFGSPGFAPRSRKELTFNINKINSNNNWSAFESPSAVSPGKLGKYISTKRNDENSKITDQLTIPKLNCVLGTNYYNQINLAPSTCLHKYSNNLIRPKSLSKINNVLIKSSSKNYSINN